ncbi:Secreted lipase [Lachnellula suecica]|uniref:Secreted lipase n=1 Tax=Lachnellula suecica TaxID=602035 RepID=A0A8T9CDZ2_9HELO|nr:Secreted lipase [Lachnellula suecica]
MNTIGLNFFLEAEVVELPRLVNMKVSSLLQSALLIHGTQCSVSVTDQQHNVTYNGLARNGIEVFLNIPFGLDTSGSNRVKPP